MFFKYNINESEGIIPRKMWNQTFLRRNVNRSNFSQLFHSSNIRYLSDIHTLSFQLKFH